MSYGNIRFPQQVQTFVAAEIAVMQQRQPGIAIIDDILFYIFKINDYDSLLLGSYARGYRVWCSS